MHEVSKEHYELFTEVTDEFIEWIKTRIEHYSKHEKNDKKKAVFKIHLENFQTVMRDNYKIKE